MRSTLIKLLSSIGLLNHLFVFFCLFVPASSNFWHLDLASYLKYRFVTWLAKEVLIPFGELLISFTLELFVLSPVLPSQLLIIWLILYIHPCNEPLILPPILQAIFIYKHTIIFEKSILLFNVLLDINGGIRYSHRFPSHAYKLLFLMPIFIPYFKNILLDLP